MKSFILIFFFSFSYFGFSQSKDLLKDVRDGKSYKVVKIGTQTWMAENLNFNIGNNCWCYNEDTINCQTYGRLYGWEIAKSACPNGWHLPSDDEWKQLTKFLGENSVVGGKLKEPRIAHWSSPNKNLDYKTVNISGFTALPGGYRGDEGTFRYIGLYGHWWTSSEMNSTDAWKWGLAYDYAYVNRLNYNKNFGFSVRCVKN